MLGRWTLPAQLVEPIPSRRHSAEAAVVLAAAVVERAAVEVEAANEPHRAEGHLQDVFSWRNPGPCAQGRFAPGWARRDGGADGRLGLGQEHTDEHPGVPR